MSLINKTLLTVLLTVLLPVLLQACAVQQQKVNSLAERLDYTTPGTTLLSLEAIRPSKRDRGQYLLNTGLLKSITGDFEGAIQDLQSAKNILNSLQAISVSENLAAATINETLRSYDSSPSERVLLHVLLSIDYLMQNDLDAARVEVLQTDVVMNELAREDGASGQLPSAHFIAGLVYELGGEFDDARISYRKAEKLMALRNMSPPSSLVSSLLSLNWRLGVDEGNNRYREQFFLPVKPADPDTAEIVVIYWDGVVTSKRGRSTSMWSPELNQIVSLALPYYPPSDYVEKPLTLSIAGQEHRTETIEDIEALLREDLDDESAAIFAMTLARMVSKHQIGKSASKQNNSMGMITNIFAMLSETADIRSWNMLPSSIQISRFSLPPGEYWLPFPLDPGSQQAELAEPKLAVAAGEKIVLFVPGVSERIFSYTQASP
jgi:hypothetical protein